MADTVTANSRPSAPIPNRYLEGAYAPVAEEVTLTDLVVTGTLPPELDGRYLRNGPNPLGPVDPATYHWFTGDAMVHGLRLRDGRAEWYRNRWVRSTNVSEALGEPPAPGERHGGMETANTNVIDLGGYKLQVVEACSGLRYMFSLASLGFMAACLFRAALWKRIVLVLSTLPITIAMNSLRIAIVGLLVNRHGIEMADGFIHEFEGFSIFGACLVILFAEIWVLARIGADPVSYTHLTLPTIYSVSI